MIALIGGCLLLCPAMAFAGPPANDNFEDAEVLEGALPVEVTRSNLGATEEAEEYVGGFSAARHSVWFEWEATGTGFVTIGICGGGFFGDFRTIVGVFTGTEIGSLTQVAKGNASEGPNCPFTESEFTFKAAAGASYKIAVDGNAFYVPPAGPPPTEGEFDLHIEATPVPANDDFEHAATLEGEMFAEGVDRFYRAEAPGHNWGATKESGEPDHNGNTGGASAWYSWTAPADGIAQFSICCSFQSVLGVYQGDSVGSLAELTSGYGFAALSVTTGTTYRIAVDGQFEGEGTGARQGSFNIGVSMPIPEAEVEDASPPPLTPAPLVAPPVDVSPPNTRLRKRLRKTRRRSIWVFHFRSSEPGSTFRCKLDRSRWRRCRSPLRIRRMRRGRHALRVAAVDAAGNRDLSPAVTRFAFKRRKHRTHRRSR